MKNAFYGFIWSKKYTGKTQDQVDFSLVGENDEAISNKRTIIDVAKDVDVKKELDSIATT